MESGFVLTLDSRAAGFPPPGCGSVPPRAAYMWCKTVGEWLFALILLALTLPLILLCAAVVRVTSHGPAFYRQARLGRYGRPYAIYKIRTMVRDCENTSGPVWATPDDPRVTRFGHFLRLTHLDELPQLWNVLRGEMSIIGPRPERPEIASKIERGIPAYASRLVVRPGITGLAQMKLPADRDLEGVRKKLAQDLYYLREMSLLLDARIAVATAFHLLGAASTALSKWVVKSCGQPCERNAVDPGSTWGRFGDRAPGSGLAVLSDAEPSFISLREAMEASATPPEVKAA